MELREGEDSRLELPSDLTNTERKFIHQLAGQLGLVSKSTGKGENRRIAVSRRAEVKNSTGDEESMPVLNIGKSGIDSLKRHTKKFPPTHEEVLESRETGASLMEAVMQGEKTDEAVAATLNYLGLGVPKEAQIVKPYEKHVNLERRKSRHAYYQSQKTSNDKYAKTIENRSKLPAFSRQEEIVSTIAANPVTVIQGETGCGKSTQCPQFLLDANPTANIVVTQRK
jgi:HrpA-like RNA helicase